MAAGFDPNEALKLAVENASTSSYEDIPDYIGGPAPEPIDIPDYIGGPAPEPLDIPDYIGGPAPEPLDIPDYIGGPAPEPLDIPDYIGGPPPPPIGTGTGKTKTTTGGGTAASTGGLPTSKYSDPTFVPGSGLLHVGKMGENMSRHELKQLYNSIVKDSSPNYNYVNDVNPEFVDIMKQTALPFSTPQPSYSAYSGYAHGGTVQALAEGGQPDQSYATQDTMAALKSLGALGFDGKPNRPQILKQGQMGGTYTPRVLPQLAALLKARGMTLAEGGQPDDHTHPHYDGTPVFRTGGLEGAGYVEGKGDGQSDDIPAMLADGEYVFDAQTVADFGNGSNKAGAKMLDAMREAIRAHKRSSPLDSIPPKSKTPEQYLMDARKYLKGVK
jgi:hypothetical protein